jgi:hypothetical protein
MFGFSLSKLIFTALAVYLVWWVYRKINMIGEQGDKPKSRVNAAKQAAEDVTQARTQGVEDLSACPACGTYVAAGSNPGCGRPPKDCPMQR